MFRRAALVFVLGLSLGCDGAKSPGPKAEGGAPTDDAPPAKNAAADEAPAAPPAGEDVIPEAEYPKAIVGKWKKVSSMIAVPGGEPFDALPPGMEMTLEFTAEGGFINAGVVAGKAHSTTTTYKLDGSTFRVGTNEAGIRITELSATAMVHETVTESGKSVDTYERVP
ncbi:MAG: hypothetical protein ACRBN8_32610 [Nannocystales bacterium]